MKHDEDPFDVPTDAVAADVARALAEDIATGDVTAQLLPDRDGVRAYIVAKEDATVCGVPWATACFRALDPACRLAWNFADGERIRAGQKLVEMIGRARALVSAERSALNFLQTLSGTATTTRTYVERVDGTRTRILDTRKTLPGLRQAQKYAVRVGGGKNHRIGLFDAFLVKENHIAAAGSIAAAVARAREIGPGLLLEVEVESLAQLAQAIEAQVDRVMLDELERADLPKAVEMAAGRCELEISGGVTLDTVREFAEIGVDYVSVGALTKHVRAIDLSMRVEG